jgi:hypothetical protein
VRVLSIGLLSLSLLSAACATSSQGPSLTERRDAIRQSNAENRAEFERTYRGQEGFQSTRWSMSPQEVMALYPGAQPVSPMILFINTQVVERSANVYFFFTEDRLALVSVEFIPPDDVRSGYSDLDSLLTTKYGRPVVDEDSLLQAYASGRRTHEAERNYDLRRVWDTRETRIELIGHRAVDQRVLDLRYESLVLGARVEADLKRETARHQRERLKEL